MRFPKITDLNERQLKLLLTGSVALVAIVLYANSIANGFAYDDDYIIKLRDLVHGVGNIPELLTAKYWPEIFYAGLYRPLILVTYAIDWTIWNGQPFGFHLVNVLLHAAVSAVLVLFLLRFFPWWAAWAGGIVFAVHSVHTEAVANVVGRAELMIALFALAACMVYMSSAREGRFSIRTIVVLAILYALAGFTKELGFVLPGLLLATDLPSIGYRRAGDFKSFVRRRVPLFVVLTGVLVLLFAARWVALGTPLESQPDRIFTVDASYTTRLFTMARVWPRYFELMLFPLDLSADYSPAIILPATSLTPIGAAGFALILTTLVITVLSFRRAPEFAMAVVWVAIGLMPVSNLVVMAEIVLAERTLYLPSVAVSIVVALLLSRASATRRRWLAAGLTAWVLVFSAVTVLRNPVWESTDTVFENIRRRHPESSRVLYGVASQFYDAGEWERAKRWFDRSLEIWPHHAPYLAEYALYLTAHGEHERADTLAAGAVRINPTFPDYRRLLVMIHARREDWEGAIAAGEEAIAVIGDDASIYVLQSEAYARLGDFPRAIAAQEKATWTRRDGPTWSDMYRLAFLQAAAGDVQAAILTLRRSRELDDAQVALTDSMVRVWSGLE